METSLSEVNVLTPEQQRAYNVLTDNIDNWKNLQYAKLYAKNMFHTSFVTFSYEPFVKENLPQDPLWIWNQSNAKTTIRLDETRSVTIQKMNPRRRRNCPKPPSFKLWLFVITDDFGGPNLYFLWCEKGLTPTEKSMTPLAYREFSKASTGVATSIGTVFPNQLDLKDLAFLRVFTDEATSKELGWV